MMFFDEKNKVMYAEDMDAAKNAEKNTLWKVAHTAEELQENMRVGYSSYLADDFTFTGDTLLITSGLDVGTHTVSEIKYKRDSNALKQDNVIIRTNDGTLIIDAPTDTIYHYGNSMNVNIIAVDNASYHGNAVIAGTLTLESGNVVLEKNAEIGGIVINAKPATAQHQPKINANLVRMLEL